MKNSEAKLLLNGLYILFWSQEKGGGYSYSSVGSMYDGTKWYAPCNWTCEGSFGKRDLIRTDWDIVEAAEMLIGPGGGCDLIKKFGELLSAHLVAKQKALFKAKVSVVNKKNKKKKENKLV